MKIGLSFYQTIHSWNLGIANPHGEHSDLNQVWMVVARNLKKKTLLSDSYTALPKANVQDFRKNGYGW
jgi:hypothetical protein